MRYLSATLFFLVALGLELYNLTHTNRVLAMPLLGDLVPALRADPRLLGHVSAACFAGVGLILLGLARWAGARQRGRASEPG